MNRRKIAAIIVASLALAVASTGAAWASIGNAPDVETAALADAHLERTADAQQTQAHADWVAGTSASISSTVQAEIDHSNVVVEAKQSRGAARSAFPGGVNSHLATIAQCESGGDPGAVSSSGTYRGKYQFDRQTWAGVGGSGDPAAASEAEQDARAAQLYAERGSSPWRNCA